MQNLQFFPNEAAARVYDTFIAHGIAGPAAAAAAAASGPDANVEEQINELETFTEGGRKVSNILTLMRKLKSMLDFSNQFDEEGRFNKNARKLTYGQIFGDCVGDNDDEKMSNTEGMFNPPVIYNGSQMTFLKQHRGILLSNPVKLQKVKFGFLISQLTDDNLLLLKDGLKKLNVEMQPKITTDRAFYIRGVDFNWYDINGNPCAPSFGGPVKVKISLQGYKIRDGIRNPIWKLLDVFDC